MKEIWRMSDDEYDYMCLNLSDDELNIFGLFRKPSISELKLIIKRTNELIDIQNNLISINHDDLISKIINN